MCCDVFKRNFISRHSRSLKFFSFGYLMYDAEDQNFTVFVNFTKLRSWRNRFLFIFSLKLKREILFNTKMQICTTFDGTGNLQGFSDFTSDETPKNLHKVQQTSFMSSRVKLKLYLLNNNLSGIYKVAQRSRISQEKNYHIRKVEAILSTESSTIPARQFLAIRHQRYTNRINICFQVAIHVGSKQSKIKTPEIYRLRLICLP